MPMVISPESELGKELAKWNRPYVKREFPKMLYRAQRRPDGVPSTSECSDSFFGNVPGGAEAFNARCQITVENEQQMTAELQRGWHPTPQDALDAFERAEVRKGDATAHRHYEDRSMSPAAQAEAKAADDASFEHLPEIPEKHLAKKRGRPAKAKPISPAN